MPIDHLALRTDQLERKCSWYVETLDFHVDAHFESGVRLRHPDGFSLVLLSGHETGPPETRALDHFAIAVNKMTELEGWSSRLIDAGYPAEIHEGPSGWAVEIQDPDGLEVELFFAKPSAN